MNFKLLYFLLVAFKQLLSVIIRHILDIWAPFGANILCYVVKYLDRFSQFTFDLRLAMDVKSGSPFGKDKS